MITTFGADYSGRMSMMVDQLYAGATTRDAICQPMVDDLRARTGRDGTVARAGLDQEDFDYLATSGEAPHDKIRIAYAGTIQVENAFELFVSALKKIREQLSRPISLEFFGNHSYRTRRWFDSSWMAENGSLPALQLAAELKKCTWGFSPMSLTDDDPRYNRFSFPAKFTSYLAAGLPLIVLGHPESSAVKMAAAHEVGLCSTTMDLEVLSERLLTVLSEPNPRLKYHAGIRRCAAAEFDARRMRAALYECFKKCASVSKS
jgi:glycosyltransferase involved in cell wall biosynthesis